MKISAAKALSKAASERKGGGGLGNVHWGQNTMTPVASFLTPATLGRPPLPCLLLDLLTKSANRTPERRTSRHGNDTSSR
jgi:hypothetical protein